MGMSWALFEKGHIGYPDSTKGYLDSTTSDHGPGHDLADSGVTVAEDLQFLTMVRKPTRRVISGYLYNLHECRSKQMADFLFAGRDAKREEYMEAKTRSAQHVYGFASPAVREFLQENHEWLLPRKF